MEFEIVKFKFKTPLHIGSVRADYDISEKTIHSDTLYSAIFSAFNKLGLNNLIPQKGSDNIGFTLSSLFPFTEKMDNEESVYFFPKPFGFLKESEEMKNRENRKSKKIKNIEYYDLEFLNAFLSKTEINYNLEEYIKGKYLSKYDFDENFFQSEVFQRVRIPKYGAIDKEGNSKQSEPYYVDRIFFKADSGFYCLIKFDNDEIRKKVISALKYLGDEGIGTDRHIGNGLFDIEFDKININIPENTDYYINLSLFCPESQEQLTKMLDDKSRYEIISRGGWITDEPYMTYRKKSINMFKEGSVFAMNNEQRAMNNEQTVISGKMVDLKPDETPVKIEHPIWRVGKSIFIPVKV